MKNYIKPFQKPVLSIVFIILVLIGFGIWWQFTDVAIIFGNYGKVHTYIDIALSAIMIVGFPFFIIGILYRGMLFGHGENLHHKTGIGTLGGFIGTVLSGCSCCGLTLASYFGLLPIMGMLPYSGLEIKIAGTLGLLWAITDTYKHLEVCRVRKSTK